MSTTIKPATKTELHDAGEQLAGIRDAAVESVGKRVEALGALIKEHPIAAVGIGLGVGYILARILHRDR